MSGTDKARDVYERIPSSTEYIPRSGTEPRALDLRALDDMAKRGAFDGMNRPHDAPILPETNKMPTQAAKIKTTPQTTNTIRKVVSGIVGITIGLFLAFIIAAFVYGMNGDTSSSPPLLSMILIGLIIGYVIYKASFKLFPEKK